MRLIFIRHGEPDYDNDCLTENGRIQAQNTAARLKNEGINRIYASPMGRAVETASYTAKEYGLNIETIDFMHEIDWGDIPVNGPDDGFPAGEDALEYNGHPWTLAHILLTEEPGYVGNPDWDKHHYFKDNKCLEYYHMISDKFDRFLTGFGYVRDNGLYIQKEKNDDTIALFAHGGSGAVMFSHVLNLPFPFVLTSMTYGVCSVSVIEFIPETGDIVIPRLKLFNDMLHIDKEKLEKLRFEK